jgi:hypothetical protein
VTGKLSGFSMHRKIRIILAARSPIPFPLALAVLPKCYLNALLAAVLMLASAANAEVAPAGDAVLRSELGEGQFYLLPGRRVFVRVSASL